MREQELKARDKTVRKMTRDGLVEKNLTAGTQTRVSRRTVEISLKQTGPAEMVAGHRAGSRTGAAWERQGIKGKESAATFPGVFSWPENGSRAESPMWEGFAAENSARDSEEEEKASASMRAAWDKPFLSGKSMFREAVSRGGADRRRHTGGKKGRAGMTGPEDESGEKRERDCEDQEADKEQESASDRERDQETEGNKRGETGRGGDTQGKEADGEGDSPGTGRRKKKYEKAQKRVKAAGKRMEEAQSGLPTRRRLRLERYYGEHYGKLRHRLLFEKEVIPEDGGQSVKDRVERAAELALSAKAHQKLREVEKENAGVEAGHRAEHMAERGTAHAVRRAQRHLAGRPCRRLERAEQHLIRREGELAYRRLLNEHPELHRKYLKRWIQKRRIKHRYAQTAREAAKGVRMGGNLLASAGNIIRSLAGRVVARKAVFTVAAAGVLFLSLFGSLLSSCSAMLQGAQAAVISTCYVADDKEINESELLYTELETDLKEEIADTEENFPDYDEYLYNIGEIGHNPWELMGYLSAAFDAFTFGEVEEEIMRLFGLQYELVREETVEIRTWTDEEGQEQEEEWRVLKTTLFVRPLSEIIAESLPPGDGQDRYGVYMETCGNRQCYANPFDFPWAGYVTSPYGYRIHPISGKKNLHKGIDIGAPQGTPIRAVQDGVVLSAGDAGGYGLCVLIEGEDGYESRYAHCSALSVSAGQEVKKGEVIAYVGSTGNSTGPHLHLEVIHDGEYLNPYYFVDNGNLGYTAGVSTAPAMELSGNPGEPMGEEAFAALLAEAERYLGFPYVWGGSSPETSFDCSGYVSFVLDKSGAWDVGRQTAQGLSDLTEPVSREELVPGDLVFFTGTYSTASPVSHVGIYTGEGRMIHAGDPVSYADITGKYWSSHYYGGGRLP